MNIFLVSVQVQVSCFDVLFHLLPQNGFIHADSLVVLRLQFFALAD